MGEYNELYHHGVKGQKWGVRRTPVQLGYMTRRQNVESGIVFKKHDGFYLGSAKFGNNPKCEFRIKNAKDKVVANEIANDKKLEFSTRNAAIDKLYAKQSEDSKLPKDVFQKQVNCHLVDIGDFNANGKRADVAIHYSASTGDVQSFLVDSRSHSVVYPQ